MVLSVRRLTPAHPEVFCEVLEEARAEGLRYVEITTDPDDVPSQRVIEANGGELLEEFDKPQPSAANAGFGTGWYFRRSVDQRRDSRD